MAVEHYVYVIVLNKNGKLYKEAAFDNSLVADQNRFGVKDKTHLLKLRVYK